MESLLIFVNIALAIILVIIILLQRSEGGALGLGVSQDNFTSARSVGTFLTKLTSIVAALFIICSIAIVAISRDELFNHLKANSIYARRYFYPLITEYSSYKKMEDVNSSNYPIALQASKEILCLPIYPNLSLEIVQIISNLIKKVSF